MPRLGVTDILIASHQSGDDFRIADPARSSWAHHLDNVAEVSAAKAHAARTVQYVTNRAMVLCGEQALEPGHPVEKWYRDAKIYDIFEGTGQIQRRIIARQLTGQNPT